MMDPVTLQVFANHAEAAADAMAHTLIRTAHSAFVKETEDFTSGITTPDGLTFASPRDLGSTWFVGLDYGNVIRMIAGYEPGDVCITNDPYSGYVCTHTPDMHMWKPIFWKDEIVAFAVGHIHNTDVGGAVPASLSRQLTEIHQEGIRIPPSKLYMAGQLDTSLRAVLLTNVRMPEQNWGDLKAQLASLAMGERKILAMIEKFGIDTFRDCMTGVLDLGERRARSVIASVPDGEYRFVDYIDEDSPGGFPVRLALNLKIEGDECVLDFNGSDPQLQSSMNVPTGGAERHMLLMIGYMYALYTLDRSLPLNAGIMRPARCVIPEGSILNPVFPAAVGMRSMTCGRLQGLIMGAFHAALPQRMPAGPGSSAGILNVKTTDARSGRRIMASINPITGGAGGSAAGDGSDGSGANSSFLKNTPVEVNENEVPMRVLRYGLVPDSGGPGKFRGGLATEMEFEVFSPDSVVTARNRDRTRFSPWGGTGGMPGMNSGFWRIKPDGRVEELGNSDIVSLSPGEKLRIRSAGGGGWGAPWERDADLVIQDVRQGKISVESAGSHYGVLLEEDEILASETGTARHALAKSAGEVPFRFNHNAYRIEYERRWSRENYDALTCLLAAVPSQWRHFLKRCIFESVEKLSSAGQAFDDTMIQKSFTYAVAQFPELRAALSMTKPASSTEVVLSSLQSNP